MKVKNRRYFVFLFLLFGLTIAQVQAEEPLQPKNWGLLGESALQGRIVEINEEHRFVVVNLGSAEGVEEGMIFNVFQKDEEIAKIKSTKVRRHLSACSVELVYTGRGIGVGDVAIYKMVPPLVKMFKPLEPAKSITPDPIIVDIDAPRQTIFLKTSSVFNDFGVIVTESDSANCMLKAYKNTELPFDVSLLTDWGPFVRNKIYFTAEINTTPKYNRLIIYLRGVYDSEGQLYNHEIEKSSSIYRQVQEMAFTIKDLAERL